MHNYKKLIVWQKAVDLAAVYETTKTFPESEKFGITIQRMINSLKQKNL